MFYRVDAFALALSQHYRVLKEVTWDGKGSFDAMAYGDAEAAEGITDIIENIGGKGLASYCRLQFAKAWLACDVKLYNVREILEFVRDNAAEGPFKEYLTLKLDSLVELIYRLSNPIEKRHRTRYRKSKAKKPVVAEQMMLFPDMEVKEEPEKKDKPAVPKKPRKPRKPRRSRMDKLADEIIAAEYGNDGERDDDDMQDGQDAVDHYSGGYSRMSDRDFGYFSGQSED
jgi:hypothetical protein